MTKEFGPREKFFSLNGLVCLVQSLENKRTLVDLRNESSVYGIITNVDVFMNISLTEAVFINSRGEKHKLDNFFVQARNIRYVHIPEEVPVIPAIERQLGKIINPGRGKQIQSSLKTFKIRRAQKKQQETVAMIEKIKEERLKKERSSK